jgi:hypothetical protein
LRQRHDTQRHFFSRVACLMRHTPYFSSAFFLFFDAVTPIDRYYITLRWDIIVTLIIFTAFAYRPSIILSPPRHYDMKLRRLFPPSRHYGIRRWADIDAEIFIGYAAWLPPLCYGDRHTCFHILLHYINIKT